MSEPEAPASKWQQAYLETHREAHSFDRVQVHYLLSNGERRSVLMPSRYGATDATEAIGEALARNDRRIRGKRL